MYWSYLKITGLSLFPFSTIFKYLDPSGKSLRCSVYVAFSSLFLFFFKWSLINFFSEPGRSVSVLLFSLDCLLFCDLDEMSASPNIKGSMALVFLVLLILTLLLRLLLLLDISKAYVCFIVSNRRPALVIDSSVVLVIWSTNLLL